MTYSIDGNWLVMDGQRVLYCEGNSPEQMEAIRIQYQLDADAPKVNPDKGMVQAQLTQAVQTHLDNKAKERGYDSIFTACTYEGDPNPTWSTEGTAYKAWRSQVWQYCLQVLADVQNQLRPIPTEAELLAELPVFGG